VQRERGFEHLPHPVAFAQGHELKGTIMLLRKITPLLFAGVLAAGVLTTGCTVHAGIYDPYHHDYHAVDGETVYYGQWETETHRDHKELKERDKKDQKEYWDWRHKNDQK
jgi:hypothetical protein